MIKRSNKKNQKALNKRRDVEPELQEKEMGPISVRHNTENVSLAFIPATETQPRIRDFTVVVESGGRH